MGQAWSRVATWRNKRFCRGFTVVELIVVFAIIATLAGIAVPVFSNQVDKARNARTVVEIRGIEKLINLYAHDNETLPDSLGDVGRGGLLDPWGNPYQYKRLTGAMQEKPRKDRFLVPVNSDYDLYSKGKDGDSKAPFTAQASRDDIVRANDGGYVGLAAGF